MSNTLSWILPTSFAHLFTQRKELIMKFLSPSFFALLGFVTSTLFSQAQASTLPSKTLYNFPTEPWAENLAIRRNGHLLTTMLRTGSLYNLNTNSIFRHAEHLYTFPSVDAALGITEVYPDVFAVAVNNITADEVGIARTSSVWKVDFTSSGHQKGPKIEKIVDFPDAVLLNGMVALPSSLGNILIADSDRGVVYKLDINTRKYGTAIDIPELAAVPNPLNIQSGVNGIRIHGSYLYFSNTARATFYRVPLTPLGTVLSNATVDTLFSAAPGTTMDDFAIDGKGTAWLCTNNVEGNRLLAIGIGGKVETTVGKDVIGNLSSEGLTSAVFGKGGEKDILFVTMEGESMSAGNGTRKGGAKVLAVDTRGFRI
jgi:hypothetical protein